MTPYSTIPITIKQWAEDDRPREKLLLKGRQALSDAELIAILISTGTRECSAVDLAKQMLLLTQNNLTKLGQLSVSDLTSIKGIGEAKAVTLIAALELGRRRKLDDVPVLPRILSSKDIFDIMEPVMCDLPHEEFWILLLNRANKIVGRHRLSSGGVSSTVVDVKILCKQALQQLASAVVLVHNHPSGRVDPSDEDRVLTRKIHDALRLFDIKLVDHLIIANKAYYSFSDEGLL